MQTETNKVAHVHDLLDSQVLANPYPVYHRLRAEDPVHWNENWDCWILTRYTDVLESMKDSRLSNARIIAYLDQLPETVRQSMHPLKRHISTWLAFKDPPDHTRLRQLVSNAFSSRVVEAMRPRIEAIVSKLLQAVRCNGRMDVIHDFAHPLPSIVITEMLGVPPEGRDQCKKWSDDIVAFLGSGRARPDRSERAQQSVHSLKAYMQGIVTERRKNPKEDLVTALIDAEEQGAKLSEEELVGNCISLLIAGHETTTNLIGNGLLALLQNPAQLQKLKENPALIETAVEELLRYDSPLQRNWRMATEDLVIGGRRIREGQIVLQLLSAANRDPAQFPDPDRLDITRRPNRHVAFGYGIHFCLGAPLARVEAQIAIRTLLGHLPALRLTGEQLEWQENIAVRALKSLPVEF